jgi:hypothetical protein
VASLEYRGKALEDEFFKQEEAKQIAQRKTEQKANASKDALRAISGMDDDAILDKLLEIGIAADTVSALSLVPLVEVAWADGEIQDREREAIVMAAQGKGIEKDSPAHQLLVSWLKTKPQPALMTTWVAYVGGLDEQLTGEQFKLLKRQVVDRALAVAEAAGGILGLKKISATEREVLDKLEAAFDDRAAKIED